MKNINHVESRELHWAQNDQYKKEMSVIEVDDELAIKTCRMYNYKYTVITPDDFVIPPKNDNLSKD